MKIGKSNPRRVQCVLRLLSNDLICIVISKPKDKNGRIVRPAPFQSTLPSGTIARVEPNRRWFGNTRVISQDTLQSFKEAMKIRNPYEVILRQTRLPISLLDEKKTVKTKSALLTSQSFSYIYGDKA
ncbi:Nucleolar GTP-binding protein 2 [Schistosoma japonicum]|nr:Nucleolar GTP-binding protein 2 [Schistosoma japonicum]